MSRNMVPAQEKLNAQQMVRDKTQECLRAGAKLLFHRRFEDALVKLDKVNMFDPKNANAYALKSKCYLQLCDLKSAIMNLKKAVSLAPDEDAWPRQVSILMDAQGLNLLDQVRCKVPGWRNQLERAIEFFSNAIEADGTEPFFWLHRAIAFTLRNSYSLAVSDLQRYTALDNSNAEVYIMLAKLNWRMDAQHSGQVNLDKAHKLDPNHPEVQILKRSVAKRNQVVYQRTSRTLLSNDTEGTLEELDRALFVSPTNVNMLLLRAATHRKLGNLRESLADIKRAKEAYTRSVVSHRKLLRPRKKRAGESEEEEGAESAGPEGFGQVQELPEMTVQRNNTLNEMGIVEMKAGHVRAAWSIFNQVVQADERLAQRDAKFTRTPHFLLNRGDAQRHAQNWPQAFEDYWKALQLNPNSSVTKSRIALVYNEFAVTQFNRKNYVKASLLYSKAIDMSPDSSHLYLGRAKAQYFQGNLHTALDDLQLAVKKDPGNREAAARLQQLTATHQLAMARLKPATRRPANRSAAKPQKQQQRKSLGGGRKTQRKRNLRPGAGAGAGAPSVTFPPMHKHGGGRSMQLKLLPGKHRSGPNRFVPPSFGAGFRVMPRSDVARSIVSNDLRTTRPLP